MLTGVYTPTSGTIELRGKDVTKLTPHERVKIGISRTFQNIRLFKRMSVLENVKVSSNIQMNYSIFDGIFKTKKYWEQEDKATEEALEILEGEEKEVYIHLIIEGYSVKETADIMNVNINRIYYLKKLMEKSLQDYFNKK